MLVLNMLHVFSRSQSWKQKPLQVVQEERDTIKGTVYFQYCWKGWRRSQGPQPEYLFQGHTTIVAAQRSGSCCSCKHCKLYPLQHNCLVPTHKRRTEGGMVHNFKRYQSLWHWLSHLIATERRQVRDGRGQSKEQK